MRELHVDAFGLLAEDVHLLDHGHFQQAALDVLRRVGQLGVTDAVALDGVEQAVHVAVLVIEDRTDDALGQLEAEVAQLLARLIPGLLLVGLGSTAFHGDRHAAIALARKGDHLFEVVQLLELLLHAIEQLVLHLLCSGAGPHHHRSHGRHGEVGIFELPESRKAERACYGDDEDQKEHDGAMVERPFGEIERFHGATLLM